MASSLLFDHILNVVVTGLLGKSHTVTPTSLHTSVGVPEALGWIWC